MYTYYLPATETENAYSIKHESPSSLSSRLSSYYRNDKSNLNNSNYNDLRNTSYLNSLTTGQQQHQQRPPLSSSISKSTSCSPTRYKSTRFDENTYSNYLNSFLDRERDRERARASYNKYADSLEKDREFFSTRKDAHTANGAGSYRTSYSSYLTDLHKPSKERPDHRMDSIKVGSSHGNNFYISSRSSKSYSDLTKQQRNEDNHNKVNDFSSHSCIHSLPLFT